MSTLLSIYSVEEAKCSILNRDLPNEFSIDESVANRIETIFGEPLKADEAVRRIIADVRHRGDAALIDWAKKIDHVMLDTVSVSSAEIEASYQSIPAVILDALELSVRRVRKFYQSQPMSSWINSSEDGMLGQLILPINRIGVYVPGGTAPLPSSLIMSAVPARVAGVREIIVFTPPDNTGRVPDVILAAAHVCGIDKIYKSGGAMAIAAMAYGTESVKRVDKIVGPGNLFVMLAKQQVYGAVGIDGLLGPTETMIIADESATAATIAADLLAQAEHDTLSQALLVTPSNSLAEEVAREIDYQAENLSRREYLETSLRKRGGAIIVPDLVTAFDIANEYAPEHLQLSLNNPVDWLGHVKHAGAVFLGEHSFEVLGDYVAGPSHSLPTSGTARFNSGINLMDFVKITGIIGLTPASAAKLSRPAAILARAETLTAHASAADFRIECDA